MCVCVYIYVSVYIHTYMVPRRRVAGPPPPKPRLSFQQTVIRHPRNCPPKLGLAPWSTGNGGEREHVETQDREPQGRGGEG